MIATSGRAPSLDEDEGAAALRVLRAELLEGDDQEVLLVLSAIHEEKVLRTGQYFFATHSPAHQRGNRISKLFGIFSARIFEK